MKASDSFLQQLNSRQIQFSLSNGNVSDPSINLNIVFSATDLTYRAIDKGKEVLSTQDITEFCNGIDEIFALTSEAWAERLEKSPDHKR